MPLDTTRQFGPDTTAAEVVAGLDLTGKVAMVTGASTGLGAETARALASTGAHVIMTARNMEKAREVADGIVASTGNPNVEIEALELASLASVRECAERVQSKHQTLDILINNAGVMACPKGTTEDGFERQFGTNHLGHFLLTVLLAPALGRATGARVVNLSSAGHRIAPVDFEDPHFSVRSYDKWASYGQSKTANVLFTVGLQKRLESLGAHTFAVHPGIIHTDLARHMPQDEFDNFVADLVAQNRKTKTIETGSATSVYAATDKSLTTRGGSYLSNCQVCEVDDETQGPLLLRSYAVDPEAAERLWVLSEELVGERLA